MPEPTNQKRNSLGQFKPKPRRASAPGAAPVLPSANPAQNIISDLIRAKSSAQPGRDLLHLQREISRFETALTKTWNPFKILLRNSERKGLEGSYGPIDWKK